MRSLASGLPDTVAVQVRRVAAELDVEADTLDAGRDVAGRRTPSDLPGRPSPGEAPGRDR